jgi:hypothetical protein
MQLTEPSVIVPETFVSFLLESFQFCMSDRVCDDACEIITEGSLQVTVIREENPSGETGGNVRVARETRGRACKRPKDPASGRYELGSRETEGVGVSPGPCFGLL